MIRTFADRHTQELYVTGKSERFPAAIAKRAARKLEYVDLATQLNDLKVPPGNRLRALEGNRKGHPEMALRLAKLFGNSPEFWLNSQRAVDLWDAAQAIRKEVARIQPLDAA